jgi:hypothetical protein
MGGEHATVNIRNLDAAAVESHGRQPAHVTGERLVGSVVIARVDLVGHFASQPAVGCQRLHAVHAGDRCDLVEHRARNLKRGIGESIIEIGLAVDPAAQARNLVHDLANIGKAHDQHINGDLLLRQVAKAWQQSVRRGKGTGGADIFNLAGKAIAISGVAPDDVGERMHILHDLHAAVLKLIKPARLGRTGELHQLQVLAVGSNLIQSDGQIGLAIAQIKSLFAQDE